MSTIITVLDLSTLRYPETQNKIDVAYWRWIEPISLKHANRIIAIAEDVAHDLEDLYGISRKRIQVVRLAPDDRFRSIVKPLDIERVRRKYQLPRNMCFSWAFWQKRRILKP